MKHRNRESGFQFYIHTSPHLVGPDSPVMGPQNWSEAAQRQVLRMRQSLQPTAAAREPMALEIALFSALQVRRVSAHYTEGSG